MGLTFNLRHLEKRNLELQGELSPESLGLVGVDELVALGTVHYELILQKLNLDVLVRGSLTGVFECQCVRCLRPFNMELQLDEWMCDLPLEGEEQVEVVNDSVDLTPHLREDILLAFPQHPLCEPGCPGLLPLATSSVAPARLEKQAANKLSAWAELDKLEF